MSRRASLVLLTALAALGWFCLALGLALTWVTGRFFASMLGWA